jgi:hypothetical protein
MIQMEVQGILYYKFLTNNTYVDIFLENYSVVDVRAKYCVASIVLISSYKNNGIHKNI